MLAQLPVEIIDQVIECLSLQDIRAVACVCSALRPPALLRLFRTIRIRSLAEANDTTPSRTEVILSHPNLLHCASRLIVKQSQFPYEREISIDSLWPHLPMMYRLTYLELDLPPSNYAIGLSTLEGLGLTKEIELNLRHPLTPELIISDTPLPVRSLSIRVNTLGDQVTRRLLQKCSQSLRKLHLSLQMNRVPSIPPLPHLCALSLHPTLTSGVPDLALWFPFLDQHPTITRLSIDRASVSAVPIPPNILPNLQSLKTSPVIGERLIPGRPVHSVQAKSYSTPYNSSFPGDIMSRVLRPSNVPLTILEITRYHILPEELIKLVQTLPKLRKFTLERFCYQDPFELPGTLSALGRCKDMLHIRLIFWDYPLDGSKVLWSRSDFVSMIQAVQERGAANLWSFELQVDLRRRTKGYQAMRVGWLDVPWQPDFKGEWRLNQLGGSSEDSGMTVSAPSA